MITFGRDFAPDVRDYAHQLGAGFSKKSQKTWHTYGWRDLQGDIPRCVGSGWAHWLHSSPIRQKLNPQGIYELSQYLDEWEGNDYEGTSVRAGAKVLKMLGAIESYRWTWNVSDIIDHLLEKGPMVVGTNWYKGMNDADEMRPLGRLEGGHAYLICGAYVPQERFKIKNSWNEFDYGYIGFDEMQILLDEDGEACVGIESDLDG